MVTTQFHHPCPQYIPIVNPALYILCCAFSAFPNRNPSTGEPTNIQQINSSRLFEGCYCIEMYF